MRGFRLVKVLEYKLRDQMEDKYDVVIIGGSYAGLSAAMTLGRAIRKVLVIDSGKPCNQQTPHSHNFLTQDGNTPAAITTVSKSQVMAYPTVEFMYDQVILAGGEDNNFTVDTLGGQKINAKKLLFTTGVKDLLPAIKGFEQCWGISVIYCPYCHGYEYKGQPTGILGNGDAAFEFGRFINHWTDKLTIFTNGKSMITEEQQVQLVEMKINIIEEPVQQLQHLDGYLHALLLANGELCNLSALYARIPFEQHCKLPEELGCSLNEAGYLNVDEFNKTNVAGIYAAGDNSSMLRAVAGAVANGSKAAAMINHEMIVQRA